MKDDEKTFSEEMMGLVGRTGWIQGARDAGDRIDLMRGVLEETHAFRTKWAKRMEKPDAEKLAHFVDALIVRFSLELDTCFIIHTLRLQEARAEALKAESFYKSVLRCIELTKTLPTAESEDLKRAYREAEGMEFEPGAAFTHAEERAEAYDAEYRRELARFMETWPERMGPDFRKLLERLPLVELEKLNGDLREARRRAGEALAKLRARQAAE